MTQSMIETLTQGTLWMAALVLFSIGVTFKSQLIAFMTTRILRR